ncbi:4-hydroxybutyryl-CoA dehydratase/vinylacetyl-CoA-Delta-isomerase [Enhygromyxa salina]|uniref:4-hydroxybutyryl-CoA dehydratase/vinylacetyl-CoA-Delta-isomerase n=1 Tax=Enhygromyxa salina TaxID=215803 RepID=A0A2S9YI27_9BACT|nr:4-hydroxyphenylacetate 3-hydroxylase N-terminal domain-containing protein [Enhygromyxa salina]PRQ04730.1 4-hydroxybutyryl-CoA dehydratase/vinylacetyl-CoA-Delta-isomerase [Enhygromyxa salina]
MATTWPLTSGAEYIDSLRGRDLAVYLHGERVAEPVDHPIIRPSINAVAETYDLAAREPELATTISPLTGERINRFLHVAASADDLVAQNMMQRKLGQLTGTCFQRCVGMDALNALYSVTFELDAKHDTPYHGRLREFIKLVQSRNCVIGGAMTDPKGDRSKAPHQQSDPDLFVHVVERNDEGVVIRGAKAHQTGCINSHWLIVMPTMRLGPEDRDYAVIGAIPVDAPGITYIYGRQSCDTRSAEPSSLDRGNPRFSGQEALVIFDDVFIPWDRVFMDGEVDFAAMLVERFTCYHRRSYVCKTGVGDVLIGAAATIADYNGVPKASHIRDKLVEMTHLNETIYGIGIASSHQAQATKSGCYLNDDMLANVCKHHVTKLPYEIARLAQDLAGGLVATLPSAADLESDAVGALLEKYLKTRDEVDVRDRWKILRLIENMTLGRNAVGYLTESMHGAGSPQAQRIQIARAMQLDAKKQLAKRLADIEDAEPE